MAPPNLISARQNQKAARFGLACRTRATFCRRWSALRRNFSSRRLCRSSFNAALASAAEVTLTATAVPSILV
jgi:hypothetical protein